MVNIFTSELLRRVEIYEQFRPRQQNSAVMPDYFAVSYDDFMSHSGGLGNLIEEHSFNDHYHDRLKILLLSNRKGDIFEGLDIHIAFAPGFVNLHEFSKLHAKIRGSPYC
jgi:hypothetical protein